ncbi:MAG TPA: hypothetical protein ENK44_09260 [Caldithrix abyssi]|uniref:Uncharacterized protein n=1 Tax=Caldithrix abyssi TaxID=187145 RepID=A0A7V4WVH3_CALAY|nr:hypothetical protein [Caldithrix abyssi]
MFGLGMSEIAILLVIVLIIFSAFSRSGMGTRVSKATLVLREFTIHPTPSDGLIVKIAGRAAGFKGWLLTVTGIDAETVLAVSEKNISFTSSSLSGEIKRLIPLTNVSSTHCGYSKPILFLIIGTVFILLGIVGAIISKSPMPMIPNIILGIIFFVIYSFNKKILVSVETKGGAVIGISFKRSLIENVDVNISEAKKAISVINDTIIGSTLKE